MDTRTGVIYGSLEDALAAGVPRNALVQGPIEALKNLQPLFEQRDRTRARRQRKRGAAAAKMARRAQQRASRKRNWR